MPAATPETALYWWHCDSGVTPDNAPDPWTLVGPGGTISDGSRGGLSLPGVSGVANFYCKAILDSDSNYSDRQTDRIEVQARMRVESATMADDDCAHAILVDDGYRSMAFNIGPILFAWNPGDGNEIMRAEPEPGGWSNWRSIQVIKIATEAWEVWVDGRLVLRVPYMAAWVSGQINSVARAVVAFGFTAIGSSDQVVVWDFVEVGLNTPLAPQWQVDRLQASMPSPIQARWNDVWRALARMVVGQSHTARDLMDRVHQLQAGGVVPLYSSELAGDRDPREFDNWTLQPNATDFSIVRERFRFEQGSVNRWMQYDIPAIPDYAVLLATIHVSAKIMVDRYVTEDPRGYIGPFIQIRNNALRIGAFLVHSRANVAEAGWLLTDGQPAAALGARGDDFHRVDPYREHQVDLYVLTSSRVLLFVDGVLAEDVPYTRFSAASSTWDVRVGRAGSADVRCLTDFASVKVEVTLPDPSRRPWFIQHANESLVFVGGSERNDHMQAYLDHQVDAFRVRGTDRCLPEIRRITCDDDTAMIQEETPAAWYLESTYPEVTPVFLEATVPNANTIVEYHAGAPNWKPEDLGTIIRRFFLPFNVAGSRFRAALTTNIVAVTTPNASFTVDDASGFSVGDEVEFRSLSAGTIATFEYDASDGRTDVDIRDFGPGLRHAARVTPANAAVANELIANERYPLQAYLHQVDPAAGTMTGFRGDATGIVLTGGFTALGWFQIGRAKDAVTWWCFGTKNGIGTGGFTLQWTSADNILAVVYSAGAVKSTPALNVTGTVGAWQHLACRYSPVLNTLELWVNGVLSRSVSTAAFTPLDPPAGDIGVGCTEAGASPWKGDIRAVQIFTRALTDGEMVDVYGDQRGREALYHSDASLWASYLPSGISQATAKYTAPDKTADTMTVASFAGAVWASWSAWAHGKGAILGGVQGSIQVLGLQSDRINVHTAGAAVKVVGGGAGVNTWVEVFGTVQATGLGHSERVHALGTTPAVSVTLWGEVHGAITDGDPGVGGVLVKDNTTDLSEYSVPNGFTSSGMVVFDPPILAGPSSLSIVVDAADTSNICVAGQPEGYGDYVEKVTLNGTTAVVTVNPVNPTVDGYLTVRALALGMVSGARTLTIEACFCATDATVRINSTSGADDMGFTALGYTPDDAPVLQRGIMAGAGTVEVVESDMVRVIGVELDRTPAGTVKVFMRTDAAGSLAGVVSNQIILGYIVAAVNDRSLGSRPMDLVTIGTVRAVLSQAASTVRRIGVVGYDMTDTLVADIILLDGTDFVFGAVTFKRLVGLYLGSVPSPKWVVFLGTAGRYKSIARALLEVPNISPWVATSPVVASHMILDTADETDVTISPGGSFTGIYSVVEATVIDVTDPASNEITVSPALAGSFGAGDIIRKA